ncbi:MAG TPA: hypothetical protein DCL80_15460 [Balneola sp.]|nr:hypothetical protein [Balneola sp.]MAC06613.1 hypothetical protein [Balneola sp.]MAO78921.1 hypothetical protein [Balneola sp.]MBF63580.1 hypothetical protein [Balneola sp.]HAH52571.1 hypothetical protein [Balneola sp.]|tara:strand:+ start:1790 stop:3076 length:1287 start_codon:yes stop_codon:yes gene_type:complete
MKMKTNILQPRNLKAKAGGVTSTIVANSKSRSYPAISKHVTPTDFKRAFLSAKQGNPAHLFEILKFFYNIDDEIPGAMQSLKSAITGNDFSITPNEDDGEAGKRQADVFKEIFEKMDMLALIDELLDGHYYGFSSVNIPPEAWSVESIDGRSYQIPTTYEVIPRSWLYAKKENKSDECNTLYLGDEPYYTYEKGAVLLFTEKKLPSFEDIDFTDFGVGLACIMFAVRKYFNEEDAAAFGEVFATPMIVGKVGPGGSEAVVKKAVMSAANDARMVIGENDTIEFPQSNQSGSVNVFDSNRDAANKAIAKIIKSESLTDNMGKNGSYAAMYTTNGIRKDVATKLKQKAMRVIMRHFVLPIVELNWNGKLMCNIDLVIESEEDKLTGVRVLNEANKTVPLSRKQYRKELNLDVPEDEEDTIPVRSSGGLGF